MQHLGRNIFSLVLSRVLSGVVLFLIYTKLVQYLGPEAAGHFGLLGSYVTVFNFFVDLGMSQLVIKKMSEDATHVGRYLSNYFFIQAALGVIFMGIMSGFIYYADYPEHVKTALYIASAGLLLSSISLPFRSVVVAMQKLTITAQVNFFNSIINGVMLVLAIVLHQNIFFLSFISIAVSVFDLIVYYVIVNRRFAKFEWTVDWAFIKQLFVWNTPFMLLTFFSIYNRVDGLILPHFRSFVENGYYSAAYKFWDTLAFFPGLLGITLYPYFAQAISKNLINDVKVGLETYTRYMIAVALPMAAGAYILSEQLTVEFFGPDFLPAAPALWLLVLAVSILFIYAPANSLMVSQLTGLATKVTGFTFIFNVGLNLILIPKYGFVAAAAVTAASELSQTIGYSYFIKKKIVNYNLFGNFVKPLLAALLMSCFLYFFRDHNLWLVIAVGGSIYAASLFILKFFQASDWQLLRAAVQLRGQSQSDPAVVNTDKQ